ncbi:hypothetical protein GCM10009718_12270 [Isoptericola halotolerans]|uniref:Uncharacterized protein n=1 Tax=Isoptericola halotolerans TaxID=300560 RepID=A0ABX2A271_9MICO|nr:hypothetical protein [Isoptericola halotolerans]NOV95852.1 hypothetical protein [Isoptericola halotolerans]
MRTITRLVPVALLASLSLSGCALFGTEDATFEGEAVQSSTQPETDGAPSDPDTDDEGDDVSDDDAATPAPENDTTADASRTDVIGVTPADPDQVVADATFTLPGTDDDVRVGIESLTTDGSTTELRLVLTPQFVGSGNGLSSVYTLLGTDRPQLVDRAHLKTYQPIHHANWHDAEAAQGESIGFQIFFAAPQDDVSAVDVQISSSWPVFDDVPLTSGE